MNQRIYHDQDTPKDMKTLHGKLTSTHVLVLAVSSILMRNRFILEDERTL